MSSTFLGPLLLEQPLAIDEARRASHALAQQRRAAEGELDRLTREAAEAERIARKELARSFLVAEGDTAAMREAHARSLAADAFYKRDLGVGLVKACIERLRGLEGERAQLRQLSDWSMRMSLDMPVLA
jgi:predicted solute-binding protein